MTTNENRKNKSVKNLHRNLIIYVIHHWINKQGNSQIKWLFTCILLIILRQTDRQTDRDRENEKFYKDNIFSRKNMPPPISNTIPTFQ